MRCADPTGLRRGEAGADWKSAAQRLGDAHHVGCHAAALMGEEAAGAADAGLHLVEHQEQLVLVAQFAQAPQERRRHHPHAALALDRLDQDRRGFRTDGRFDRLEVAERNLVEARHHRAEPFQVFFLAAGGEGRERTPVEGAFERNDAVTLGPGAGRGGNFHEQNGSLPTHLERFEDHGNLLHWVNAPRSDDALPVNVRLLALCLCRSLYRFTQSSLKRHIEIATHLRHALIAVLAKERRRFVIFKNAPALLVLTQNHHATMEPMNCTVDV
jgi:hypothetical protein